MINKRVCNKKKRAVKAVSGDDCNGIEGKIKVIEFYHQKCILLKKILTSQKRKNQRNQTFRIWVTRMATTAMGAIAGY